MHLTFDSKFEDERLRLLASTKMPCLKVPGSPRLQPASQCLFGIAKWCIFGNLFGEYAAEVFPVPGGA